MAKVTEYLDLLPWQHADKPKFVETITKSVAPCVSMRTLYEDMSGKVFDLDAARNKQLDAIGLWVNASRSVDTPLDNIYFALDTPSLGFDQGAWKGPFDPDNGITSLGDEAYRLLIRAKIAANNWDGTMESTRAILDLVFNPNGVTGSDTFVFIEDNQDMTMSIGFAGVAPDALSLALIVGGYITLKPSTVGIDYFVVASVDKSSLFGFDIENQYVSGFDEGVWGTLI